MPRNARVVAPGLPYHITQRGTNRESVFFNDQDRLLYLQLIRENLAYAQCRVLAYCLMTNHVHFVIVPGREDSLAMLFARVHGKYSQAFNIQNGRSGHLWQARFHSCPLSEARLWVGLQYVEGNPCRAGMVQSATEYLWSSARPHLLGKLDESGILDMEFWQKAGGVATWEEIHGIEITSEQEQALHRCTYAGRPYGDEVFVREMEVRFQRKWRRLKGAGDPILAASA